jgi:invasion protein IalB
MLFKIFKNIFLITCFFLYLTSNSLSEITSDKWSTRCSEDKKTCVAVIKSEIKNKDNKMQTIATAYVQIGSSKQKKMNLINKDDQTYKLSEENKNVPILFVRLPLNIDLRKKALIIVDDKKLGNLEYTHCLVDGCMTSVVLNNNDIIDLFKKGKTMTIIMGVYGASQNINIQFPLKNFSKSYTKLIKN